jgi:hypothetical protein
MKEDTVLYKVGVTVGVGVEIWGKLYELLYIDSEIDGALEAAVNDGWRDHPFKADEYAEKLKSKSDEPPKKKRKPIETTEVTS